MIVVLLFVGVMVGLSIFFKLKEAQEERQQREFDKRLVADIERQEQVYALRNNKPR